MLTTSASYKLIAGNMERTLASTAKKPIVAREAAYYLENIEKVKSIDDFMKDDRLFAFAMKAFGLADMTYAKAFMRKALTEGVDKNDSFANKLTDVRYRQFVTTFNFKQFGETTTVFNDARQGTVDRYIRQTVEEDAGAQNEGVRLALYFERKASSIKNAFSILGDKALLQVVQTALNISPATSLSDIDKQAALIESRLDIEDLKDPKKLQKFLDRFTSLWELSNGSSNASSSTLLLGSSQGFGISASLLQTLQGLKLGGR